MAGSTQQVFATIGAMQTLTENFPMGIFEALKNKSKYTSVLAFLVDLLLYLGVDTDEITDKILNKIFGNGKNGEKNRENIKKLSDFIKRAKYNISEETLYDKLADIGEEESPFIDKAEDAVKIALGELLSGLLSCNCIPVIPNTKMDLVGNKPDQGFMSIPVSSFDLYNKLSIPPTTSTGTSFYQMDSEYVYKEIPEYALSTDDKDGADTGDTVPACDSNSSVYFYCTSDGKYYKKSKRSLLTTGNLYQTDDLDAFIWYVMNRGVNKPQIERNKMMWDSRLAIKKASSYADATGKASVYAPPRNTDEEWKFWLNSKEDSYDELYYSGQTRDKYDNNGNVTGTEYGYDKNSSLFPIMQLEREDVIEDQQRMRVYISAQRYYLKGKYRATNNEESNKVAELTVGVLCPNHTMYKFNYDYLKSIRLFSTKQLLANMVKFLYGGSTSGFLHLGLNFNQSVIEAKVKKVIANIIEADDTSVENCYYTFSNEDFDDLLYQSDLEKYNAVSRGYMTPTTRTTSTDDVLETINGTNSSEVAGTVTTAKKSIQQLTTTEGSDGSTSINASVGLNGMSFLETIMMGLLMPFVEGILSPKVVLLLIINMDVAGLINLKELSAEDTKTIEDFLWKKIFALLSYLIVILKDLIVELLVDLFNEYVAPLIEKFIIKIVQEKLEKYIDYLEKAMSCIPVFNINWKQKVTTIAEINYADIDEKSTPENNDTTSC